MKYVVLVIIIAMIAIYFNRSSNNAKAAIENNAIAKDFLSNNKTMENVIETDSGLQYQILQQGDASEHPTASSKVKVHYHGTLLDGTVFDSSVERGEPISFGTPDVNAKVFPSMNLSGQSVPSYFTSSGL